MKRENKIRIKAVELYLKQGSLAATAAQFNIHRNTLWRWVKHYREDNTGFLVLPGTYKRHWRRKSTNVERTVKLLKERNPGITVVRAKAMLKKQGFSISPKCIWRIWQRYGLTGFKKEHLSVSYREHVDSHAVHTHVVEHIQHLVSRGQKTQAAQLVNTLPVFPYPRLLSTLPENKLTLARRLDRLSSEFGTISLSRYRYKAHALRIAFEKEKKHYSAIRAGIDEGYALMWLGQPEELNRLVKILTKKITGIRDPGLHFGVLLLQGHVFASFLQIPQALKCAKKCKTIIRRLRNPAFFMSELAGLYSLLGYYKDAIQWTRKALQRTLPAQQPHMMASLVGFLTTSGDFHEAIKILKTTHPNDWDYHSRVLLVRAFALLNQGSFTDASVLAIKALEHAKKEEIRRFFHLATFILACSRAALGEHNEARMILKKYIPYLKRHRLEKEFLLRKVILGETNLPPGALNVPNIKLAYLFLQAKNSGKANDYQKTLKYARSYSIFGLFERMSLFFPEPVTKLLKKRKNPQLPRTFLHMPVFRFELPAYNIGFLGRVYVNRGETKLHRLKLSLKDYVFLIHLSFIKERKILLDPLYENFWPRSISPARNLSHLLVRIKKALSLPTRSLGFKQDHLVWTFYLNNDHDHFREILVQAKTLARAGEWSYARREFLRAFGLFRGMPFKKMYDTWSEDKRSIILNNLESELVTFKKLTIENNDEKAYHVLRVRLNKSIPFSERFEN